jgi:predicted nuclease with TOPRIM domain
MTMKLMNRLQKERASLRDEERNLDTKLADLKKRMNETHSV